MKGYLFKTELAWLVKPMENESTEMTHPLHPDDVKWIQQCFTSKFTSEVEYEVVEETFEVRYGEAWLSKFAKLIPKNLEIKTDKK